MTSVHDAAVIKQGSIKTSPQRDAMAYYSDDFLELYKMRHIVKEEDEDDMRRILIKVNKTKQKVKKASFLTYITITALAEAKGERILEEWATIIDKSFYSKNRKENVKN